MLALFLLSLNAGSQTQDVINLLDINFSPEGHLQIGTNAYVVSESDPLTNHLTGIDAIAVQGGNFEKVPPSAISNIMHRLAGHGLPIFIVDKDEESELATQPGPSGKRTLTVSSDQLSKLLSGAEKKPSTSEDTLRIDPILFSSVEIDEDTGEYGLSRLELGVLGRKVWFVHESAPTEDGEGTTGIHFKQAW